MNINPLKILNGDKLKMSTNDKPEVKTVPPAVADFLSEYHTMRDDYNKALQKNEDLEHLVATLDTQITGYRKIIEDLSARQEYYMRLCVEMRTHFGALQAMCREADKAFTTGPYRNNGAISKEALQMVADDINQAANNEVAEEIPGFLVKDKEKSNDRLNETVLEQPKTTTKPKNWSTGK